MTVFRCRQISLALTLAALVTLGVQLALALDTQSYVSTSKAPGQFTLAEPGRVAPLYVDSTDFPGVIRLASALQADIARVTGIEPRLLKDQAPSAKEVVLIGTLGKSPTIDRLVEDGKLDATGVAGQWDAFLLQVVEQPIPGVDRALVIAGSNKRGTIYGMFDLSAEIGVSPWYWWADVPVERKQALYVNAGRHIQGPPAVKYRGIFLNDEGWALTPWVKEKFGDYNSKFYTKVFELLLRLKANYLWPAMWNNAFNEDDPDNPRLADEYGIVMGTTHQEPMLRAQQEWDRRYAPTLGHWNYYKHAKILQDFWREGIRRNKDYESLLTIGLRGANDSPMIPGGTVEQSMELLEEIVKVQRQLIAEEINHDPSKVPQLWCPYKEVQEYYERGLRVPDDVTILWCDDNWGNLRRVPTKEELKRAGGAGIYYHFDFHGGPRSYEWLNCIEISKIWEQMNLADKYGATRIWIVNVGDLKPMELPISFFLDYAWNPNQWPLERLPDYTSLWAAQQFGSVHAPEIAELLTKYTKYNARRKPELLAPDTYSLVDFGEADRIVNEYNQLVEKAEPIRKLLPAEYGDAYYQLVLFPIAACANLNELYVTAGKNKLYAKQGRAATNKLADRVRELFAKDTELSRYYDEMMAGGKWNHLMDTAHIGYTSWDPPPQNNMPEVRELDLPAEARMGVAVEGSSSAWPGSPTNPAFEFSKFGVARRSIDVFNRGTVPFEFSAKASDAWIELSSTKGAIDDQQRLWVSIDWSKAPAGDSNGEVKLAGAGEEVTLKINAYNPAPPDSISPGTFVEGDGYVSIEAEHYTNRVDAGPVHWAKIPDYGRTGSSMSVFPVTARSVNPPKDSPCLQYKMYLFHSGPVIVKSILAPTLNFLANRDLRFAVSFDDEPPRIMTIVPNGYVVDYSNNVWQDAVRNSARVVKSTHTIDAPGYHTLKVWMVDPGVVLQKVVVESGNVAASYLGPPESYRQKVNTPSKP